MRSCHDGTTEVTSNMQGFSFQIQSVIIDSLKHYHKKDIATWR